MGTVGPLLAEGSVDQYRPLGAFGKPAYQSHVQLRAALLARLGKIYANYFARPTFDLDRRVLRWNAEIVGNVTLWKDLPEAERERLTPILQRIRDGLLGYVAELRQAAVSNQAGGGQALASLLEQAMTVPDESHLHVLGEQPVLSFWGFEQQSGVSVEATALPAAVALTEAAAAVEPAIVVPAPVTAEPVVVPPPPVDETRRPFAWLRWLLGLLLLLLLLLFLAWWFRCSPPLAGWFAQGGFPQPWFPWLRDCQVDVGPTIAPEPKEEPKAEPKVDPKPPVVEPKPPIDPRRMTIPSDAARARDLSFLKGRWQLGPQMDVVLPDGKIIGEMVNQLQFDENGRGVINSERVTGRGGNCRGAARARFEGDVLRIETAPCSGRNHEVSSLALECRRQPDGRTHCLGANTGSAFRGSTAEKFETWLTLP